MKTIHKTLLAGVAAVLALSDPANAEYQPVGKDGITASPKVRQLLNERESRIITTPAPTTALQRDEVGLAASPKVREPVKERRTLPTTAPEQVASVGYRPTEEDGITASPKARSHLNERALTFTIAPLVVKHK